MHRNAPCLALLLLPLAAGAAGRGTTELQLQVGVLDAPAFAGGGSARTAILTLQNATSWKYGDTFFFVDRLEDDHGDGFNDGDWYGEFYASLSLVKLRGSELGAGVLRDVGPVLGLNRAGEADTLKYLPGIRLAWRAPGFAFLRTDLTAFIDDSEGAYRGGAPRQDDSFMIDISWSYPIRAGRHRFSIEGHAEYIGEREDEFGRPVEAWVLAQPQFRYDLGNGLFAKPDTLFVGVEFQYWRNKLGDRRTDERAAQALLVWRF